MSYKAVLFDMDGTLLDTLEDLRDSTNHVLRQMGYPERSLEEMRRFVGNGAEKQIRRAVPEGTSEEKIMETLAAYRAYYQDHCQIKTRVYDGLLDMLSELKAKGIKLAVVSNKPDSAVQKLSREYFGDRMDFAVGPSDGVRCKPYPDMAEEALKDLISPNAEKEVTPELIIQVVADHFGITPLDISSQKRNKEIVFPRQIVMYICRSMLGTSLQNIGKYLGGRDHTTIIHGHDKIAADMEKNESLRNTVEILMKKISPQ